MKSPSHFKLFFNTLASVTLVLAVLGNPSLTAQAGKDKGDSRADPRLLQMAAENPDATFMVIVQNEVKNKDLPAENPAAAVEKEGGRVKKDLRLIESFSAELTGKQLSKLARNPKVRWISIDAPVLPSSFSTFTLRDEFNARVYNGSNGEDDWSSSSWIEISEPTGPGPTNGPVQVSPNTTYCLSPNCLRVGGTQLKNPDPGFGVYRELNLRGASTATLSYSYRRGTFGSPKSTTGTLTLDISNDGGVTWTVLKTYPFTAVDSAQTLQSFDISGFISSNTQIRFLTHGPVNDIVFFIDNIQIQYTRPLSEFALITGVNQLINETGLSGQGVTVAVVDSGISDHPDLRTNGGATRIVASVDFSGGTSTSDANGHGSHVAGILAGNGYSSNGKYKGVAPGVKLVNVKVSNDQGMSYASDLVESLQWIYENKSVHNIRVVNISLNSSVQESYHTSPIDAAVEILWFNGIVVVVSAGNNGTATAPSALYPPANDPFVITVGALDDRGTVSPSDDSVASFSAYGPTEDGFAKPDLVAPGRNLVSLLASQTSAAYNGHPKHRMPNENAYFRMSGTSMAAPVVSGVAALLLQAEPYLNPDQVKYRLMATASRNWAYDASKAGAGSVNAYGAVYGITSAGSNQGITPSLMLATGANAVNFSSVGWNSVGWNSVGWNSVGWNSVGWNSVGWNSVGWNSSLSSIWDD